MLSDLSNLERIKDRIPQDKIKNFEFDSDTCSFAVDPVGKITFQIVEREPNKLIKFTTTNSPVPLFLWIQLKQVAEDVEKRGGKAILLQADLTTEKACEDLVAALAEKTDHLDVLINNGIETFARGCG